MTKLRAPIRGCLIAAAAACVVVLTVPSAVEARCRVPEQAILWSYPADGADAVPLNATFWLRLSTWSAVRGATLNGAALIVESLSPGALRLDPGKLEPDTDYVLQLEPQPDNPGQPTPFEIRFRTSAEIASVPPEPLLHGVESLPDGSGTEHTCRDVIEAQGCFDMGLPVMASLTIAHDPSIVAYLVRAKSGDASQLWPARCGAPIIKWVTTTGAPRTPPCYRISAIGPAGVASGAVDSCPAQTAEADAGPSARPEMVEEDERGVNEAEGAAAPRRRAGSCSAARSAASDFGLLMLLATFALALRRARP